MRFPWLRGLAMAIPASGAYYAAGYASGNAGYAPIRTKGWVTEQMNSTESITNIRSNPKFQQLTQGPKISEFHGEDGAVSEITMSFRDKEDSLHTVTYVHCGPLTVGFPFIVHGGVLGTLLRQSAQLAYAKPAEGHLNIRYRKPTIVDNILKIETRRLSSGLELLIYSASNNSLLVEATYNK